MSNLSTLFEKKFGIDEFVIIGVSYAYVNINVYVYLGRVAASQCGTGELGGHHRCGFLPG